MVLFKDGERRCKKHLSFTEYLLFGLFYWAARQNACEIKNLLPNQKDLECISRLKTTENWVLKRLRLSPANKKRLSTSIILLTFWLRRFERETSFAIISKMLLIGKWYQNLHLISLQYSNKKIHVLAFVLLQHHSNLPCRERNNLHGNSWEKRENRKTLGIISMNTHNFVMLQGWFSCEISTLKATKEIIENSNKFGECDEALHQRCDVNFSWSKPDDAKYVPSMKGLGSNHDMEMQPERVDDAQKWIIF